jgi:hypothetical protein
VTTVACGQATLLAYGSQLVFLEELTAQTLLAFMLYQGQLQASGELTIECGRD